MTDSTRRVPWHALVRKPNTRTSAPTQNLIRAAMLRIGHERGIGHRPPGVDTVIFAAMRIAERDPSALRAEVEAVEAEEFDVPVVEPPLSSGATEPGA